LKTLVAIAGLALLTVLPLPDTAGASHDPSGAPFAEDFVTGRDISSEQCGATVCFHVIDVFDAHSGPSGEHPTGTVRIDVQSPLGTFTFDTAQVTCLDVSGNRATIGGQSQSGGFALVFFVEDNDGAGQDRSALAVGGSVPSVCPAFPSTGLSPIFGGDITVHDARVPTSKEQCKNGGWRSFPGLKNQGHCVNFVATGGKAPPAGT
jgi:hypothetical protein